MSGQNKDKDERCPICGDFLWACQSEGIRPIRTSKIKMKFKIKRMDNDE